METSGGANSGKTSYGTWESDKIPYTKSAHASEIAIPRKRIEKRTMAFSIGYPWFQSSSLTPPAWPCKSNSSESRDCAPCVTTLSPGENPCATKNPLSTGIAVGTERRIKRSDAICWYTQALPSDQMIAEVGTITPCIWLPTERCASRLTPGVRLG